MKNIYKAMIGIATTGVVATAGITTASILSNNKENEETKPVAIVNEMKNEVNSAENQIETNVIENNIENNNVESKVQENNTEQIEPKVETQPESMNNNENTTSTEEVQNNIEKTGTVKIDINSICGKDIGRVRIRIKMKDGIVNDLLASDIAIAKIEGTGIENIEVSIMTGSTTVDLTGTINFDDENPMCVFE